MDKYNTADEKIKAINDIVAILKKAVMDVEAIDPNEELSECVNFIRAGVDSCTDAAAEINRDRENLKKWEARFANPGTVTGYLLEVKEAGETEWTPYEFDCMENSNIWGGYGLSDLGEQWFNNVECREEDGLKVHTAVGFYKALGADVWVSSSDDWDFRLGVNFDARSTPNEFASPIGTWGGEVDEHANFGKGALWRVRKVTVSAEMSEIAKKFFRDHPEATWEPTVK